MRIKFTRGVEVKFISHLDLMKVFERAPQAFKPPVAYSHGFNPHPAWCSDCRLAVGWASRGEYADFELEREIEPDQFVSRLNDSLPDAVRVVKAGLKKSKANIIHPYAPQTTRWRFFSRSDDAGRCFGKAQNDVENG